MVAYKKKNAGIQDTSELKRTCKTFIPWTQKMQYRAAKAQTSLCICAVSPEPFFLPQAKSNIELSVDSRLSKLLIADWTECWRMDPDHNHLLFFIYIILKQTFLSKNRIKRSTIKG